MNSMRLGTLSVTASATPTLSGGMAVSGLCLLHPARSTASSPVIRKSLFIPGCFTPLQGQKTYREQGDS